MVNKIISRGKEVLFSAQSTVVSAATIIMLMVVVSRILGLVRQRALAYFFTPNELSLFFAAFRLPDLIFEVLVFGTFSSAFIPVFTRAIKKDYREAWETASIITSLGLLFFIFLALIVIVFANPLYGLFAPGFTSPEREKIVFLARILFVAQGFFVVSYVLTAVLESMRRFLVPALAPLFYNLGIILATVILSPKLGLLAPVVGVLFGAFSHFLIQFPLAAKLGFRFRLNFKVNESVKKIGRLALPRILEVSFLQVAKTVELFLASLISTASYTYFTFANSLQLLPVGLFGTSVAKAALPTLSRQADSPKDFKNTLFSALNQVIFLIAPIATILIVLRIPLVRLVFGTDIFSWEATVQTGMAVSSFALGIVFQAIAALLTRAFYALHDTKTPVLVSLFAIIFNIVFDFILIKGLGLGVWGLAIAYSAASTFQTIILYFYLSKKLEIVSKYEIIRPTLKVFVSSLSCGLVMFFLLKIFDRSAWVKKLSFLGIIDTTRSIPFERFVLDTRYTANVLVLTALVAAAGLLVYLCISLIVKSDEIWFFFNLVKRMIIKRKVEPIPVKKEEPVTPTPTDSVSG